MVSVTGSGSRVGDQRYWRHRPTRAAAVASPLRSSAMLSDCITCLASAPEMLSSFWPSEAFSSPIRPSGAGAKSSLRALAAAMGRGPLTSGTLMRCSSGSGRAAPSLACRGSGRGRARHLVQPQRTGPRLSTKSTPRAHPRSENRRENTQLVRAPPGSRRFLIREAANFPRSGSPRLKRSEAQQGEPVWMILTCHQLPGTFVVTLRAVAAHEAPMVQKEPRQT